MLVPVVGASGFGIYPYLNGLSVPLLNTSLLLNIAEFNGLSAVNPVFNTTSKAPVDAVYLRSLVPNCPSTSNVPGLSPSYIAMWSQVGPALSKSYIISCVASAAQPLSLVSEAKAVVASPGLDESVPMSTELLTLPPSYSSRTA